MNRTDRLLAVVLELQGRGRARAEDLARQFEVSMRTIYRDVLALGEAGVPVISVPGQGYRLMEGYFLPPLQFSSAEATMVLLGTDLVAQLLDASSVDAARQAARKISAVLRPELQDEVQWLQRHLMLVERDEGPATRERLSVLRQAIVQRQRVQFLYTKPQGSPEPREADPHGLYRLQAVWMLAAYDRARADWRSFRVDRMDELQVTGQRFERQPGFLLARDETREHRHVKVLARFEPQFARAVQEQLSSYATGLQDTPSGLHVTLQVRAETDVLPWLLSWGSAAEVLHPASLRARILEEARKMAGRS